MKKQMIMLLATAVCASLAAGCGKKAETPIAADNAAAGAETAQKGEGEGKTPSEEAVILDFTWWATR